MAPVPVRLLGRSEIPNRFVPNTLRQRRTTQEMAGKAFPTRYIHRWVQRFAEMEGKEFQAYTWSKC
ncbi:MAG TPA: hypothetical protein DIT49_00445 [Clostridiales bacterium]|nr:hypothetical protein [Clostridiales bacterium]